RNHVVFMASKSPKAAQFSFLVSFIIERQVKYQATQEVLQGLRHDLLEAVNRMMGFSRLFLEKPELMGGPLNREQLEGIELIRQSAENNYEIIKHYFFDRLKAIEVVDNEPEPEAVTLAEIGEMTEFAVESDLALETVVFINKREAETIINLLATGWYKRNKGNVLEVTAESDDTLRLHFPHTTQIPSYHIKNFVNGETGRLKFTERQRYFDPVGLATALVEKYGGAVYAELTDESICHLSFTLPVYREES
ncbi:MAG: hypothetical protein CL608_19060, partial [Anaerolineaceae bacterium]|nr:hypothetical protein [Anaerolineaceae bacterium]